MPEYNLRQQRDHIIGHYILQTCVQLDKAREELAKIDVCLAGQDFEVNRKCKGDIIRLKHFLLTQYENEVKANRETGHYRAQFLNKEDNGHE